MLKLGYSPNIMPAKFLVYQLMRSPAAVSADALGLSGVRDVLVAVGTIASEDTGAGATTGICTSAYNAQI